MGFQMSKRTGPELILSGSGQPAATVLLLPAIAGVNDYIRRVAQRLVAQDFNVLLFDYFARERVAPDVSTPEKIGLAVQSLSDPQVLEDVRSAIATLHERPEVDLARVGALGFCIGGMYALLAACENTGLRAVIDYYGTVKYTALSAAKPRSPLEYVSELQAPLLAHFGTFDRLISASDIDALEGALQRAAKPYELFRYRGAPHAFDEDFRPVAFRPVAAELAWSRTLTFLKWHLRVNAS